MQMRRFHFDKRKRRYIQLQPDETVQAGKRKRTESGKRSKTGGDESSGVYKKWMQKSKLRVPAVGELADTKSPDAHDLSLRQLPRYPSSPACVFQIFHNICIPCSSSLQQVFLAQSEAVLSTLPGLRRGGGVGRILSRLVAVLLLYVMRSERQTRWAFLLYLFPSFIKRVLFANAACAAGEKRAKDEKEKSRGCTEERKYFQRDLEEGKGNVMWKYHSFRRIVRGWLKECSGQRVLIRMRVTYMRKGVMTPFTR